LKGRCALPWAVDIHLRLQVHLFDVDIPGKISFKESETLSPGQRGTVVNTPHGIIAVGICYDLRFPELAQLYAKQGANIIIYPGEVVS
jgi:omega-amidase